MMPLIQTYTGRYINFKTLAYNDYAIEDIAHSLSNMCRFTGHCKEFYSVAQHCVIASNNVADEYKLEALMHDAVEAYLGDVSSPLKELLPEYKQLEKNLYADIANYFGYPEKTSQTVKNIDLVMLATEKRDLMTDTPVKWGILDGIVPLQEKIVPWCPNQAKSTFLETFRRHNAQKPNQNKTDLYRSSCYR